MGGGRQDAAAVLQSFGVEVLRSCGAAVLWQKKPEFGKRVYSFLTPKSIHGNSGTLHRSAAFILNHQGFKIYLEGRSYNGEREK